MKKIILSILSITTLLSVTSCNTDFDTDVADIKTTNGDADFSTYVALGNSLTSGYRDGALYRDGQIESYPNIIAQQMQKAGGGSFTQPLTPDNIGGFTNLPGFRGKLTLQVVNGTLSPVPSTPTVVLDKLTEIYNNMGVPGAKSFHLITPNYGNLSGINQGTANPYFARFASSPTTSVLQDAIAKKPTFFTLWIGNNDVLSYASSGGIGTDQTGNIRPTTYSSNDITDPNVLVASIKTILDGMKSIGAKGVIANIPNVTSIPFFTTVPAKPLTSLTEAQISSLNNAYSQYNKALAQVKSLGLISDSEYQSRLIFFSANKANGAVIIDKDLTDLSAHNIPSYRQTTDKDFILLTSLSAIKAGGGTQTPLTDAQVLTEKEAKKVQTATNTYNTQIQSLANAYNLAFVDANAKMIELRRTSGIQYNGVSYTANFITGGVFSLDGVHMTGKGYAIIANEFIKAINSKYNSTLPQVNPNHYSGITFP